MRIKIISTGNIILADESFAEQHYPGDWEALPDEPTPAPVPPEYLWYIDIGSFYDRFGSAKMDVLTSTDAAVKAIIADVNIRKWVDLQLPDVASAIAYVGSVVPAVDATLQTAILTTPVSETENLALRKLYFS